MSCLRLLIHHLYLLVAFVHYGHCCGPAEIGQQYTITSPVNITSNISVIWQLKSNVTVSLYNSSQSDPNFFPNVYVCTRTQLAILNVTKKDGTQPFQHIVNGIIVYTCGLPVYARASTPTCEPLTIKESQVGTTCSTSHVFPQAKCQFVLQNGGNDTKDILDGTSYITYTHTDPQSGGNEYYSTSCTLQYPVDGLQSGNWTVQVNMYPDQTGVSLAQGTVGHAGNALLLSCIPRARQDGESVLLTKAELAGVVIGTIIGTLVLGAAIALVVLYIGIENVKRQIRAKAYDVIERPPTETYENVGLRDLTYQTRNPPEQDPGPNSESLSQETNITNNNDSFGVYIKPVDPDPNTYSGIQEMTESTNQETENTNKNEAVVVYSHPKETDPNAYSGVHERTEYANQKTEIANKNEVYGENSDLKEPDTKGYSGIHDTAEYANQETENTNKNENTGEYIDLTENDPNVYSDIHETAENTNQDTGETSRK